MSPKKKKKKKSVKKFDLAKAVKKVGRDNTMGLNLSSKEHGDKTQYERKEQKKLVKEESDDSL